MVLRNLFLITCTVLLAHGCDGGQDIAFDPEDAGGGGEVDGGFHDEVDGGLHGEVDGGVDAGEADGGVEGDGGHPADASTRYPNEPAGYVPWFEHDWQTWPNEPSQRVPASGVGLMVATSSASDAATAFVLVDDPTAPHGKGRSLRHRQREGQMVGNTSGTFNLFHPVSGYPGQTLEYSRQLKLRDVYRSHWVYFEPDPVTLDWQFGVTHMRTFWWNRHYGGARANVSIRSPSGSVVGGEWVRKSTFPGAAYWYYPYSTADGATSKVYYAQPLTLAVGQWYHFEYLWETQGKFSLEDGTDGINDSRLRIWIDGHQVHDGIETHWIDRPFANEHFAMVLLTGVSGKQRVQDDFVRFGDIYVSGVPWVK
jgi:hypothetical protein